MDESFDDDVSKLVTVKSGHHRRAVVFGLWKMLMSKRSTDFNFGWGGKTVKVHRLVLELFLDKDKLDMSEAELMDGCVLDDDLLDDSCGSNIDSLVEFLYRGKVTVPLVQLEGLLRIARGFDFQLMVDAIEAASQKLEAENSLGIEIKNAKSCESVCEADILLAPALDDNVDETGCKFGEPLENPEKAFIKVELGPPRSFGPVISHPQTLAAESIFWCENDIAESCAPTITEAECSQVVETVYVLSTMESCENNNTESCVPTITEAECLQEIEDVNESFTMRSCYVNLGRRLVVPDPLQHKTNGMVDVCTGTEINRTDHPSNDPDGVRASPSGQSNRSVEEEEVLGCPRCDFETSEHGKYLSHLAVVHEVEEYEAPVTPKHSCPECDFVSASLRHIQHHCETKHAEGSSQEVGRPSVRCRTSRRNRAKDSSKEKVYGCPRCSFQTTFYRSYRNHLQVVHEIDEYEAPVSPKHKCSDCEYFSSSLAAVQQHHALRHAKRVARKRERGPVHDKSSTGFKCKVCGRVCATSFNLAQHSVVHSISEIAQNKTYNRLLCKICGESFRDSSALIQHKRIHAQKKFSCADCKLSFTSDIILAKHVSVAHVTKRRPKFPCGVCRKRCFTLSALIQHKLTHAPRSNCQSCCRTFANDILLAKHLSLVHTAKEQSGYDTSLPNAVRHTQKSAQRLQCPKCYLSFDSDIRLAQHQDDAHSTIVPVNLSCVICGNVSLSLSDQLLHSQTHVSRFDCPKCSLSFASDDFLTQHVSVAHAPKEPEIISCDICGRLFKTRLGLGQHKVAHAPRPLKCSHCSRRFTLEKYLVGHLDVSHGLGPARFPCEICGRRCSSRYILEAHQKRHAPTPTHADQHFSLVDFGQMSSLMFDGPEALTDSVTSCAPLDSRSECDADALTHNREEPFLDQLPTQPEDEPTYIEQYVCGTCEQRFDTKVELGVHATSHSNLDSNEKLTEIDSEQREDDCVDIVKYICGICDLQFDLKIDLNKHFVTHSRKEMVGCLSNCSPLQQGTSASDANLDQFVCNASDTEPHSLHCPAPNTQFTKNAACIITSNENTNSASVGPSTALTPQESFLCDHTYIRNSRDDATHAQELKPSNAAAISNSNVAGQTLNHEDLKSDVDLERRPTAHHEEVPSVIVSAAGPPTGADACQGTFSFKCPNCSETFSTILQLKDHLIFSCGLHGLSKSDKS